MATALGKNRCITCGKDKATMRCGGWLQEFCLKHMPDHRQELSKQLDEVEVTRDVFRQTLTEKTTDPQKHILIQQINNWERDSIKAVRRTAEETRQKILQQFTKQIKQIEIRLDKLNNQLRESREEDDFYETDLRHWNTELTQLAQELSKPSSINLRQGTTTFLSI